MKDKYDAIIIGSGPNGLAAATYLQQQGFKTAVYEQESKPGGATKTLELTIPGVKNDMGSAILPMAFGSPFFRSLPLSHYGLEWIFPDIPFAHALPNGKAVACYKDITRTAEQFDDDSTAYVKLFEELINGWDELENDILGPLGFPDKPSLFLKFGFKAFPSVKMLADHYYREERAKLLLYGAAAHSGLPMSQLASASFGLVLTIMAHKYNWPFPKGGAGNFITALIQHYKALGGELILNKKVECLSQLPPSKTYLFDVTPKQLLKIDGLDLSSIYRKRLENFKYGTAVFKMDWALSGPIPFLNEKCRKAATVHLGFSTEEITISEEMIHNNQVSSKPYVIVAQHTIYDDSRSPEGVHTAWAYCHVPNGSTQDCSEIIKDQIEKAAPGFKDLIIKENSLNTKQLQVLDPNLIGGDINGGSQDLSQLFTRPIVTTKPYTTSNPSVFICSSSTPPGGGVHGMCGYNAALAAEKFLSK
ncbi:phytoene desaturase family protein [Christiangramia aquimixticola]|uniref:phytoene desaturase family protein n=1 Tax=Christiangramia aquimixticola TaxID=1697558 RepID=UPI003AA8ACF5